MRRCFLVAVVLAGLVCFSCSFRAIAQKKQPTPTIDRLDTVSTSDREDEFPAIGCAADGKIWVAWVSYDGSSDEVLVRRFESGDEVSPRKLSANATDCWRPAMQRDGDGRLWVTWAQNEDGNWDIWASHLQDTDWSGPIRLTTNQENDFSQRLAVDASGRLWMTWQAVIDGNYDVLLARVTPEGLVDRHNVSTHPASDWEPTITADHQGNLFVGWDSYRRGSYDILVSRLSSENRLTGPQLIAASSDYEAHASLAVDLQNRLWIAWDNGGPHWGQHGEQRLRLHHSRSVQIACLDSGTLLRPQQEVAPILLESMPRFCELPKLRVDGKGRLWLIVRHLQDVTPPGKRKVGGQLRAHQPRGIWNPFALCYANGRWSESLKLPNSNGRNDMRVATCLDPSGQLWAAWAEDGRKPSRAEEPINRQVHAATLRFPGESAVSLPVVRDDRKRPRPPSIPIARDVRQPYQITVQDITYRLLYGDTHRHTDISRCGMNFDGSLLDTYRYAIDAAGLDFLAISDHDQDLLKHRYGRQQQGPLQAYAWWRSQKYCDLFFIPGRFLPIYGYEHGGSYKVRGGHKNVLYLHRGLPCYEEDSPAELFHLLRDKEAVAIPHQLADGASATDWSKWNADFERIAEIFQTRGSYEYFGAPLIASVQREGHYLQNALGGGVRIGVIASSDHGLVHGAYAGVYAKEFTRRGVLEALKNRRSFGATETMVLDFRTGSQLLGAEFTLDGQPTFEATVRGTKPLERVEIVRDGKIVYSTGAEAADRSFRFTDTDLEPGANAYYYLRSQQSDNEWAWSSAIWVQRED